MAYLKNENAEIHFEVIGSGFPLVLLHGAASDSQLWAGVKGELAKDFKLIMLDLRGAGKTRCAEKDISISAMAWDIASVLMHLNVESAHILGHSMGGCVAQQFAVSFPEKTERLVLYSTAAHTNARNNRLLTDWQNTRLSGMEISSWYRMILYWNLTPGFFENHELVEQVVSSLANSPDLQSAEAFSAQINSLKQFDIRDQLNAIKCNTLVLGCKEDTLFPPKYSLPELSRIPGSEHILMENSAHSGHIENPVGFIQIVCEFLSKQD